MCSKEITKQFPWKYIGKSFSPTISKIPIMQRTLSLHQTKLVRLITGLISHRVAALIVGYLPRTGWRKQPASTIRWLRVTTRSCVWITLSWHPLYSTPNNHKRFHTLFEQEDNLHMPFSHISNSTQFLHYKSFDSSSELKFKTCTTIDRMPIERRRSTLWTPTGLY